nr:MAG TPA: tail tube protein [Caudoviricetes sp.]
MKINEIEIAELKNLEITTSPDTKEIGLMNSPTKGEVNVAFKGTIKFEINKVYSRFKPAILDCQKKVRPFVFNLEATVRTPDGESEESVAVSNCWLKGDMTIFALNSDNDFLSESYEAGFSIENLEFTDIIDDGNEWESIY